MAEALRNIKATACLYTSRAQYNCPMLVLEKTGPKGLGPVWPSLPHIFRELGSEKKARANTLGPDLFLNSYVLFDAATVIGVPDSP